MNKAILTTAAQGGNNTIYGEAGNDIIKTGAGQDIIDGGADNAPSTQVAAMTLYKADSAQTSSTLAMAMIPSRMLVVLLPYMPARAMTPSPLPMEIVKSILEQVMTK